MSSDRKSSNLHARGDRPLLTVKEYADITREHPNSVYRRIREGRQSGVTIIGTRSIRVESPKRND